MTGASSGIGAATAVLLAREGANVALLARGNGLEVVTDRASREGGLAFSLDADVTDRERLEAAVDAAARKLGGLDVVVVGAAVGAFGLFAEMPARDFDRCVAVTFGGAVNTIRAALPHLERSKGRLIVIGSAADAVAISLLSPYVAAKHALDGFVDALRSELRAAGSAVSVSVVRPGPVDSPFWRHLTHPAALTPPALPPLSCYSASTVARAVVACAIVPRANVTVGGAMKVFDLMNALARPAVERLLSIAARVGRSKAHVTATPDALWESSGDGTVDGGLKGRPSLLAAVRLGRSRPSAKWLAGRLTRHRP